MRSHREHYKSTSSLRQWVKRQKRFLGRGYVWSRWKWNMRRYLRKQSSKTNSDRFIVFRFKRFSLAQAQRYFLTSFCQKVVGNISCRSAIKHFFNYISQFPWLICRHLSRDRHLRPWYTPVYLTPFVFYYNIWWSCFSCFWTIEIIITTIHQVTFSPPEIRRESIIPLTILTWFRFSVEIILFLTKI
jgi:hypothetical protein